MAKSVDTKRLFRKVLTVIGEAGIKHVRPKIPSKSLRKGLNLFLLPDGVTARIQIPHYWALYVHDGRGPFSVPLGRYMVWFRDPADDPRLRGRPTPVRVSDLRHLTKQQFFEGLQANHLARQAGAEPPMIVTRVIRKATRPTPFFENGAGGGMAGFVNEANRQAFPIVQGALTRALADLSSRGIGNGKKPLPANCRISK